VEAALAEVAAARPRAARKAGAKAGAVTVPPPISEGRRHA
jgi:hypothetical protein